MIKNEILKTIEKIYNEKKENISSDFNKRLSLALEIPEFSDIFYKRKNLIVELNKLKEQDLDYSKVDYEIKKCSLKLLKIIKKNNIDLNYHYQCKDCKDTGFINKKEECHCRLALKSKLLKEFSNLPKNATATFKSNKFSTLNVAQAKIMNHIYIQAQEWVNNFNNSTTLIFMLNGGVGIGKTTLSYAICNALIEKGNTVYYSTAFDLYNIFVDKQFNRLAFNSVYDNLLECDLLVIDDLGTEFTNTLGVEHLFAVIDSRVNNEKKTLICSNLNLAQLRKRYGERSASRLTNKAYSFAPTFIDGNDLRKI